MPLKQDEFGAMQHISNFHLEIFKLIKNNMSENSVLWMKRTLTLRGS